MFALWQRYEQVLLSSSADSLWTALSCHRLSRWKISVTAGVENKYIAWTEADSGTFRYTAPTLTGNLPNPSHLQPLPQLLSRSRLQPSLLRNPPRRDLHLHDWCAHASVLRRLRPVLNPFCYTLIAYGLDNAYSIHRVRRLQRPQHPSACS